MFKKRNCMQVLKWSCWDFVSPLVLQKINVDNFNQLDDYRVPFCEQYIYLQNAPKKTVLWWQHYIK